MALDKDIRLAVEAKLRIGISPKEVSEQLDVKLSTVYTISQKLEKNKSEELVQDLHSIPQATIAAVVTEAREKELLMPTPQGHGIISEMETLSAGADGLKKLDMSFQTTVSKALKRFDEILDNKDTPLKEIKMIIDTTANAYEKVFASGTNIHIGDNNNSSQQLTVFKSKQGV